MIADASTLATVRFWLNVPVPLDRNDTLLEFTDEDLTFLIEQSSYVEEAIALGWLKRAMRADALTGPAVAGGAIVELQVGIERTRYSDPAAERNRKGAFYWYEYWMRKIPGFQLPDDALALQIAVPDVAGLLPQDTTINDPDTIYRDDSIHSRLP